MDYLLTHPRELGIDSRLIWTAKEIQIYRANGRGLVTDIDLLYQTASGIYIVEYKTSDRKAEAVTQLRMGGAFVFREFHEYPKLLYTYSPRFITEEIK